MAGRNVTLLWAGTVAAALAGPMPVAAKDIVVDGSIRARETVLLNHDFDSDGGSPDNYATLRTRVGLAATVGEYAWAYVELQDSRVFGEPKNTVTSLEQVDLHQGYIHLHNAFNTSLEFKLGRQEMAYGYHRQVGSFDWSDVGRSFDGLLAMYDVEDVGWFHAFAMKTLETGGIAVGVNDGDGVTREPGAANAEGAFLGAYAHFDLTLDAVAEAYLLDSYEDLATIYDDAQREITDPSSHRFTLGARVRWRREDRQPELVHAEAAFQFGTGPESVPPGTTEVVAGPSLAAYAFTAAVQVGLRGPKTWLLGQVDVASGDGDPGQGDDETYRQLFPTGHHVLGLMDFVGWQNVVDWQLKVGATPAEAWQITLAHHVFRLMEPADTWYGVDGRPFRDSLVGDGSFSGSLGRELDLSVGFSPEPDLEFEAILGIWWPGLWQEQATTRDRGASVAAAAADPDNLDTALSVQALTRVAW